MKYQFLTLCMAVGFSLSCSGQATTSGNKSTNSVNQNVNSNILTNSNIANPNPTKAVQETTTGVNAEILRQIEEQQKEDKRLHEEKLKNAGKSPSTSNSPAQKTVPKGNQQTF
jgi:hypothetical protein